MQNKIDIKEFEKNAFSAIDDFFSEDNTEENNVSPEIDAHKTPEVSSEISDEDKIDGLLLSLEWEFNKDEVNQIIDYVSKKLDENISNDYNLFYTILLNISRYLVKTENQAHPQTFQILKNTYDNFIRYQKVKSQADKKIAIETTIHNYKIFKKAITSDTTSHRPSQKNKYEEDIKKPIKKDPTSNAEIRAIISQELQPIYESLSEILSILKSLIDEKNTNKKTQSSISNDDDFQNIEIDDALIADEDSVDDLKFDDKEFENDIVKEEVHSNDEIEPEYVTLIHADKNTYALPIERVYNVYKIPISKLKKINDGEAFKLKEIKPALHKWSKGVEKIGQGMSEKDFDDLTVYFVKLSSKLGKHNVLYSAASGVYLINCDKVLKNNVYLPSKITRQDTGKVIAEIESIGTVQQLIFD